MKKGKLLLGIIGVIFLWSACQTHKEQSLKGVITEASMNTLMIKTAGGDVVTISTADAEKVVKEGILLGDTAAIYYAEKPEGGIIRATKIVVVPGQRECPEIIGTWLEAVKGMPGAMQGIRIENGGIAESVNMATLVYEHWQKEGNKLLLKGKSLGNGQTIIFTDTLHIETLSADSLILTAGGYTIRYHRETENR